MIDIDSSVFQVFNEVISGILESDVVLIYPDKKTECPNCTLDTFGTENRSSGIYKAGGPYPFDRGMPCPYCDGAGYKASEVTETIKMRVYPIQKDYIHKGSVKIPAGSLQTYFNMSYLPKIEMCKCITPSMDGINLHRIERYVRSTEPISTSFGANPVKYAMCFWSKNEN